MRLPPSFGAYAACNWSIAFGCPLLAGTVERGSVWSTAHSTTHAISITENILLQWLLAAVRLISVHLKQTTRPYRGAGQSSGFPKQAIFLVCAALNSRGVSGRPQFRTWFWHRFYRNDKHISIKNSLIRITRFSDWNSKLLLYSLSRFALCLKTSTLRLEHAICTADSQQT